MDPQPKLDIIRTENDTATRIGVRLGVEFVAVTVLDTTDVKMIADQFRALADRLDPQPAPERMTRKRSARRRTVLLP